MTVIVSLDLEKAFDKICHERLLSEIRVAGFHPRTLKTIRSYLKDQRFRTVVNGKKSGST